jgi:hypothetical protein
MRGRRQVLIGLLAVLLAATMTALVSLEETPSYVPPRTPWGDPDLQGAFTNSDERGTPLEKPDSMAGRRAGQITSAELARLSEERSRAIQERTYRWEPSYESPASNSRAWLVTDPPDGKIPPLTAEASRRLIARAEASRRLTHPHPWLAVDLFSRCITRGLPMSMMPATYGNAYEIVQGPGVVAITYEMVNETRLIPLDGRPHAGPAVRSYMGDARGRFEGGTLVVETINFTGKTPYRGSTEHLRLIERFTPIAASLLEWSVTLDDPTTWTRPWTLAMNLTKTTQRPLEFACHEGNYSMRHVLGLAPAAGAPGALSAPTK